MTIRGRLQRIREWRVLLETIPALLELLQVDRRRYGFRTLIDVVWSYLGETAERWERGAPFVWYNLGFSPEVVLAVEQAGRICIESQAVLHNLLGEIDITHELIDTAEAGGVPAECCSADKAAIGAIARGLYPPPACLVGINTPCDSQVLSVQAMAELTGRPLFVIDVPYYDDRRTVEHVADQLQQLTVFLARHLGRPAYDWERLRLVCERANRATELLWEWLDWRRMVPLVQSSKLVAFTLVHQVIFSGTPQGIRLAEALAREARERWQGRAQQRFFEERVRAVWYQDPVWIDLQLYDWMERTLGLTIPVDVFGYYAHEGLIDTSSRRSMLEGLARKLVRCQPMSRQFRGNIETYVSDFMTMHEAFRADCAIFAGHVACKHAWGGLGLFREACRRREIPLLVFEFDMFDRRLTPREAIELELSRFVNDVVLPRKRKERGG